VLSLEEYIKKSEELFSYIGGYAENDSIVESCKQEYSRLLLNVTLGKKTEQNTCNGVGMVDAEALIRSGYDCFVVLVNELSGVFRSKIGRLQNMTKKFELMPASEPNDRFSPEEEMRELISKLTLNKSGKFVVITQQERIAYLVNLINEIFYNTSPIYIIRFMSDDNKEDIRLSYWFANSSVEKNTISLHTSNTKENTPKNNIDPNLGVKVTSWDTLD
jgi:hypothetical protein